MYNSLIFHINVQIFNPLIFFSPCFHRSKDLLPPSSDSNGIHITLKNFMQVSNMFSFIKISLDRWKMNERKEGSWQKEKLEKMAIAVERNYSSLDMGSIKCRVLDECERIL